MSTDEAPDLEDSNIEEIRLRDLRDLRGNPIPPTTVPW